MGRRLGIRAVLLLGTALALWGESCSPRPLSDAQAFPTYDPFVRADGTGNQQPGFIGTPADGLEIPRGPTPTFAPLVVGIATRIEGAPLVTPTPDAPRTLPTPRLTTDEYVVQPGDTLGAIAQTYGVSIKSLLDANGLSADDILALGTSLTIPPPQLATTGPSFKVIPDSELVDGPASATFDLDGFVASQGGFLSAYSEDIDTEVYSGADIVGLVARNYSVNPRLLLAVLEHQSHWVTEPDPATANSDYPLGFIHPSRVGLYRQLVWAANELNRGYYLWRARAVGAWVLNDGTVVPIDPTINAGTAAVQSTFATLDDLSAWERDVTAFGLFQTYFFLFGNPFDLAIEPVVPPNLIQPALQLPFESGVAWAFTGGPHAAWDSGSAWAAVDFAPPDVMGCSVSEEWVTAAANGFIVRSSSGAVVQDLDGDGYEETGWNILYLHVFEQGRVAEGTFAYAGDFIGHPSCEGGVSNAAHLHFARKYNGEWISADGTSPILIGGWASSGDGTEYDGFLRRGQETLEAAEGISVNNLISR